MHENFQFCQIFQIVRNKKMSLVTGIVEGSCSVLLVKIKIMFFIFFIVFCHVIIFLIEDHVISGKAEFLRMQVFFEKQRELNNDLLWLPGF